MRLGKHVIFLALLATACRTPPPVVAPAPLPAAPSIAPVVAPAQPPSPATASTAAPLEQEPRNIDEFLAFLAEDDTSAAASWLADDATVTLANGDACSGALACRQALVQAMERLRPGEAPSLVIVREIAVSADLTLLQGLVDVQGREGGAVSRVPFAAVLVMPPDGQATQARVYANSAPWRYLEPAPKTPQPPLPPLTLPTRDDVAGPAHFDPAQFASALDPALLANDATASGLLADNVVYHDLTSGAETTTALANQAAIRAFQAAFAVLESRVIAQHAAGDWLVIERETTLQQRAPVVPVPPTEEPLHVRTIEFAQIDNHKIIEIWGYSDPVAFLPAIAVAPIPVLK